MVKDDFFWIGGALWLDFINTSNKATGPIIDQLADVTALLEWLSLSGSVPEAVTQEAAQWPAARLEELQSEAQRLRGALRFLCENLEATGALAAEFVDQINEFLGPSALGFRLQPGAEKKLGLLTEWNEPTPRQLLFPIAMSAAETLSGGALDRLHKCANPNCILWFLDTSKNGKRRWCSMDVCGNRHKVSQHNLRKKN